MGLNPFQSSLETFPPVCSRFIGKARWLDSHEICQHLSASLNTNLATYLLKTPRNESQRMGEITFGGISVQVKHKLHKTSVSKKKETNQNHNEMTFIQRAFICDILIKHRVPELFIKRVNE